MDTNRCSPCGQEFTTKKILAKHLEIHHDNRKFKCVKCDKEVVGKKQLNNHMRSHKSVCCKFCGLQVAHGSLPFHQTKCSDNKKGILYLCDKCDYKTDQKGNLKRHKSTKKLVHLFINKKPSKVTLSSTQQELASVHQ